jgi:hypothetical protein
MEHFAKMAQKPEPLIISMFHSVPGVPRVKMERFAGVKITCMKNIS